MENVLNDYKKFSAKYYFAFIAMILVVIAFFMPWLSLRLYDSSQVESYSGVKIITDISTFSSDFCSLITNKYATGNEKLYLSVTIRLCLIPLLCALTAFVSKYERWGSHLKMLTGTYILYAIIDMSKQFGSIFNTANISYGLLIILLVGIGLIIVSAFDLVILVREAGFKQFKNFAFLFLCLASIILVVEGITDSERSSISANAEGQIKNKVGNRKQKNIFCDVCHMKIANDGIIYSLPNDKNYSEYQFCSENCIRLFARDKGITITN
jgi:hypothetical protein